MPVRSSRPRPRWRAIGSVALTSALVAGLAAINAPAAVAAVGAPTSGDPLFPNVGNSGYDVQHYDIDLAYRTSADISATTTIDAIAASELTSFTLDFEGLTVDGVTVNGAPATWTRDVDAAATKYKLVITPATPVNGAFTVAVSYSGAPVRHIDADGSSEGWVPTADGVTALGQPVGAMTWYPQNNTPGDKATYSIDVTAPTAVAGNAISVASTGELVGRVVDEAAATTTWQWRQAEQMASELSVLGIGRFTLFESEITLASGRTLPEWTFVDSAVTNLATVTTRRNEMKPIIDWLETKLGPYPGNSVGFIVDPPVRGSGINYALETQDRPFYPGNPGRTTFIHELVHQWLGNDVSPSTWDHIWMNEGGAEFFTDYYLYGSGQTTTTPEDASYEGWEEDSAGLWATPSVGFTDSAELYEWQVYNRGKYALGALMTALGREDFDATYDLWIDTHGGTSATTSDFVAAAEQASGRDLDAFFQDWIYDTDKPAWPAQWTAGVATDVAAAASVLPGDDVTLTFDVANTGRVPLQGATVVADAAALLAQATLPPTLPAGISLAGTTLTWAVPDVAVGETASVDLPVTVSATAPGGTITVPITAPQLGSGLTASEAAFQIVGPVPLNLLNINDFHGRIDANTVKFAGTIEQLRAQYGDENTLFLSDGDNIGASLFASSYFDDEPTIDVLNALDLSASAVGNHEFDKGIEDLLERVTASADFSYLGANVYAKGTTDPLLTEYATFEVEGLTVGVIGAVTEETPTLVAPGGIADVDFGDPVVAVNRVAAQLTDGDPENGEADVIVAEYHEGASAGTPDGATLEEEVAGGGAFADIVTETSDAVDVIFTGHTHKAYAWTAAVPGTERTRAVVQTGNYGENIGQVVLQLDPVTGDVESFTAANVARTTTADADLVAAYPRVAAVKSIVDATLAEAAVVGAQPVGSVAADITTAFSGGAYVDGVYAGGTRDDRASQSTLGNLVADSIRESLADADRGGAQIGVVNPGGLRSDLLYAPDGVVTYAEANAVLPFVNNLWTTTLTGAQFTAVLEEQWQLDAEGKVPSRPYLALGLSDNVHYTFDPAAPQGSHITGVWIDGMPIDPAADYRVGSFNFLLQGGDNFRTFAAGTDTRDSGLVDRDAWIDYLKNHEGLEPSFASRSVQVTGVPASAVAGGTITVNVAGLDLRSLGAPANTTLEPSIAGTVYPEVAVVNGAATVTLTLPSDRAGELELLLEAPDSGTVVRVPLTVQPGTGGELPSTGPGVETPAPESALTPATQNAITVQGGTAVEPGQTITIHVGAQYAGEWVSVWLRSEPLLLGWYRVDALGNVTVTLPEGVSGAHRLVVQDAEGNVIGWQQVQIGPLPATGGDAAPILGLTLGALLLVGLGVGARTLGRRRAA